MQLLRQGCDCLGPVCFHIHTSLAHIAKQGVRIMHGVARMCRVFLSDMSDVWCIRIIQKAKHKLLHFLEQNVHRMCPCILQSCWEEVSAGTVQG